MSLTIIHTADLHDRLDEARADALGFLREQMHALLLDSGDAIGAGNVLVRPNEPVLEQMNRAGYHAMAAGNREFFFRRRGMQFKTRQAQFPVLAANIVPLGDGTAQAERWTVLEHEGERVGLFGLTPTMIQPGHPFERLSDLRFIEWTAAAREAIEHLRGQVDWLIALSHRGVEDDHTLVRLCPEIDIILGGHSHEEQFAEGGPRPTLISHAGAHGHRAAVIKASREANGCNRFERTLMEVGS